MRQIFTHFLALLAGGFLGIALMCVLFILGEERRREEEAEIRRRGIKARRATWEKHIRTRFTLMPGGDSARRDD